MAAPLIFTAAFAMALWLAGFAPIGVLITAALILICCRRSSSETARSEERTRSALA
jgi:hypothetical protein